MAAIDALQVESHIKKQGLAYPVALLERDGQLEVVMDKAELGKCNGDARAFLDALRSKGILAKL